MRLNENIGEHFGMRDLGERSVGIEIEMESDSPFPDGEDTRYYWSKEHDGSLRGEYNAEYVLRNPMKKEKAFKALDRLALKMKDYNTEFVDSIRAGTHVHINVRDLTFKEMWTMVTCWYVLEILLTSTVCGKDRIGNHFCLCAQDADAVMFNISSVLKGRIGMRNLAQDNIRYSALNFVALSKYGSLEFRAMRTPRDFDKIKVWVGILLALKENSKLFPNPRHVIENFSLGGERQFLRTLLGNENAEMIIGCDPDGWKRKLQRGIRIAQEVAYAKDDWDKDKEEEEIKKPHAAEEMDIIKFARQFDMNIVEKKIKVIRMEYIPQLRLDIADE